MLNLGTDNIVLKLFETVFHKCAKDLFTEYNGQWLYVYVLYAT